LFLKSSVPQNAYFPFVNVHFSLTLYVLLYALCVVCVVCVVCDASYEDVNASYVNENALNHSTYVKTLICEKNETHVTYAML